ncbi:MAG: YggS family pyridoxal phosphate-dependent enzyme [bacterium]
MHSIDTIGQSLVQVRSLIATAAEEANRPPDDIELLAVSKGQSVQKILAAAAAGQRSFGESYIQEAVRKIVLINDPDISWHFIGRIQSNKLAAIAEHFDWVHSLSSEKHARKLNALRESLGNRINVCLQINMSGEPSKSGIASDQTAAMATTISQLPWLNLRGLMTMPNPNASSGEQFGNYRELRQILLNLNQTGLKLDTLSMGMSNDYQAAIAEGATIVRVGTAIFGPRNYS